MSFKLDHLAVIAKKLCNFSSFVKAELIHQINRLFNAFLGNPIRHLVEFSKSCVNKQSNNSPCVIDENLIKWVSVKQMHESPDATGEKNEAKANNIEQRKIHSEEFLLIFQLRFRVELRLLFHKHAGDWWEVISDHDSTVSIDEIPTKFSIQGRPLDDFF